MRKNAFIIETAAAFIILNCLNFLFFPNDPGFLKFQINPYWIAILLIASRYGLYAGLVAGLIACGHALLFEFGNFPTRAGLEKLVEAGGFVLPLSFILVGIFVGGIRQKYIDKVEDETAALKKKDESLKFLNQKYEAMEKARRVLEARIVGETRTVKTLYDASEKLVTLDTESIYTGCLDILAEHFRVEKASLYMREDEYFVLKASRGWSGKEAVEAKIPEEKSIMNIAFAENRVVTVKDILARKDSHRYISQYGQVLAILPIRDRKEKPIGAVNIEKMDFFSFTRPNLALIGLVVDWVSRVLCNKRLYDSAVAGVIRDEELGVFTFRHFESVFNAEFKRARHYGLDLAVSLFKLDRYGFYSIETQRLLSKAVAMLLKRYASDADMVFRYKFDGTFAVISPMRKTKELSKGWSSIAKELGEITGKAAKEAKTAHLAVGAAEINPKMKEPSELLMPALRKLGMGGGL